MKTVIKSKIKISSALVATSAIELAFPFIRMLMISRILSLSEVGFISVLTATISIMEQITDFAIYRYVYTQKREDFEQAIAAAHSLSILRGGAIAIVCVAITPFLGKIFGQGDYAPFFALAPLFIIRGLENVEYRVAERDYRYSPQLIAVIVANGTGMIVLAIMLFYTSSRWAFITSLYFQSIVLVIVSQLLAKYNYKMSTQNIHFKRALYFAYPLMFNGMGLAFSSQGDRFIIASTIGLKSLAIYAIVILATTVPLSFLSRIIGSIMMAQLYNAAERGSKTYDAKIKLSASLIPQVAAFYAVGVASLMNIIVPAVFGLQFQISENSTSLLAISLFIRLLRGDPFTSMLLHAGRTKKLALANIISSSTLAFEFILLMIYKNIEAVMVGRLFGEITAMITMMWITREEFRLARFLYIKSVSISTTVLIFVIYCQQYGVGKQIPISICTIILSGVVFAILSLMFLKSVQQEI